MKPQDLHGRFISTFILITAALIPTSLAAQTPTPNFALTRNPQLWQNAWPADFNRDSRTDLIAGTRGNGGEPGDLVVALGNGDGTFQATKPTGWGGYPLGTGHFNGDGFVDVVITDGSAVSILPGRGDGTFGSPRGLPSGRGTFAVVADFNNDGHRDVAFNDADLEDGGVAVYPGNGDLTFGPPMTLAVSAPTSAITGDFNGDGQIDLAVTEVCCSVIVFLNQGGLLFSSSTINLADDLADITAADLNVDGKLDLIVAEFFVGDSISSPGMVSVLLGNGDGTFAAEAEYDTGVKGEVTIVAGDFNRDGKTDIATGNWSKYYDDDNGAQLWDSIAVLTGDGTGALHFGRVMTLGFVNQDQGFDRQYVTTHNSLNTADLNNDRQTDLIGSPGAILINRPEAPNRPPSVFAGPDFTHYDSSANFVLRGMASDPDGDWLNYYWDGVGPQGPFSYRWPGPGVYTYELCVEDLRGARACDSVTVKVANSDGSDPFVRMSSPRGGEDVAFGRLYTLRWEAANSNTAAITRFDLFASGNDGRSFTRIAECSALPGSARECLWREPAPRSDRARVQLLATDSNGQQWIAVTDPFRIVDTPSALPPFWFSRDVGAVNAAGSATYDGTTFTVTGSGADIWGTADEFHWAFTLVNGDFEITTRVASVQNVHQWTKAGIMIRTHPGAGAQHASLFATPTSVKGIAFQRRPIENGTSVHTAGGAFAPPSWLKLTRRRNAITAYHRASITDPWRRIGEQVFTNLPDGLQVGFAVSSHIDGLLASARFTNLAIERLPQWSGAVVGANPNGGASWDSTTFELVNRGTDIWGTQDEFTYVYTNWSGDGTITARVRSITNTHAWAKAGVMFRASLDAGSPHVMVVATPGKGLALQYRATALGTSAMAAQAAGTAPEWVRLTRSGNTFTGATSNDGVTWTALGSVTVDLGANTLAGMAVTSHNRTALATGVFDDVTVGR
jgi:hypothetical protein